MKNKIQRNFCMTACCFFAFILWTVAISYIDLQAIGPKNSIVGFAIFNRYVHELTGVHMQLYTITDWLGLVPIIFVLGFAILGLVQLIKRKSLYKVDSNLLVLGGFYILVMAIYALFEIVIINYRPILIDGYLEASYPSSTTMLVMCVMPTAIMQLQQRIKNEVFKKGISYSIGVFTVFMVIGRFISGVHWFTDIVGGILLSLGMVMLYYSITKLIQRKD